MPARNIIKTYIDNGCYHVYNRGINKQDIFLDKKDYAMFLFFLKIYLEDPEKVKEMDIQMRKYLVRKNFFGRIQLLSYCLMPNHFHFEIKQTNANDLTEFMRCIMTNYSMYFNKRYDRVGTLFQGRYKAVLVKEDSYLLHLSRYIHQNPLAKGPSLGNLWEYDYSSYADYVGKKDTNWINRDFILDIFDQNRSDMFTFSSYQHFVENNDEDSGKILVNIKLD